VIKKYWDTRKVPNDCAVKLSRKHRRMLARTKGVGKNRMGARRIVCALDFS